MTEVESFAAFASGKHGDAPKRFGSRGLAFREGSAELVAALRLLIQSSNPVFANACAAASQAWFASPRLPTCVGGVRSLWPSWVYVEEYFLPTPYLSVVALTNELRMARGGVF